MNDLKLGYLILAHTDPVHLEKLICSINYKARIFIHLDKKQNISNFLHLQKYNSVEFISDRSRVYWGGISMVKATLSLIKSALDSKEVFSHLILLSGQDYPLKPVSSLYEVLTANLERQYIKLIDISESPNPGLKRISNYWFMEPIVNNINDTVIRKVLQKLLSDRLTKKTFPKFRYAFGSQWWAITPSCARYILKYVNDNPNFLAFYKNAHAPDEHFFHTIIANSRFLEQAGGFRENIKWPKDLSNLTLNLQGRIFKDTDFDLLREYDTFFARKLTTRDSCELIKLINAHLEIQTNNVKN